MNAFEIPEVNFSNILVGVLVDVSWSMKSSFKKNTVQHTDRETTRAESIFKTVIKIAENEFKDENNQEMFVLAFGLKDFGKEMPTCDLLHLLEKKAAMRELERTRKLMKDEMMAKFKKIRGIGHGPLIQLVAKYGAPYAEKYIRTYITNAEEAEFLYDYYSAPENLDKLKVLIDGFPDYCKETLSGLLSRASAGVASWFASGYVKQQEKKEALFQIRNAIKNSDYLHSKSMLVIDLESEQKRNNETLLEELKAQKMPKNKTFKSTINLLNEITDEPFDRAAEKSFSIEQIKNLVSSIEPYIYGYGTPMCDALKRGLAVFNSSTYDTKVLFLLTDGKSTDGNPVEFAKELNDANVCVFVCLITPENIQCRRRLFSEVQPNWTKPQKDMFELCSTVANTHSGMSILLEQGWQLPPDGESRLFLQANDPDVIDEFAKTVRRFAENTDAVLNIFGHVLLDQYIRKRSGLDAPEQVAATCYANAVAAVLHLAMSRIVGRKDGVPKFEALREMIIKEFGENGADTASVLKKWTKKYRLNYDKVNELEAKKALNARRPVVARFELFDEEWDQFDKFYKEYPKAILTRNDLRVTDKPLTKPGGHAVVLTKCDPQGLTLMNSWGNKFADDGFFKVQNQAVLNLEFFDVYWTLDDLYPEEIDSFNESKRNAAEDIMRNLPLSVRNLPFKCPQCSKSSPASSFIGHLLEATCPKCRQNFKPTPLGFVLNW